MELLRFKTISQFHKFRKLSQPEHPLISVIDVGDIKRLQDSEPLNLMLDFYCIALKRNFNGRMKYGQQEYDFEEGILTFLAPRQVFSIEVDNEGVFKHSGKILMVHPDFLWNTPLTLKIKQYEFFGYAVNEALFLSDKEELTIAGILENISGECHSRIDTFSQDIIIAQLELLFSYAQRFYQRQFFTRKITSHKALEKFETLLNASFEDESLATNGIPRVQAIAEALNMSPGYLSGLLKTLTGQSTQQHIHDKLIEKAKEKLSTTDLSVSEIAYELGFEHPQSFSKLFKTKTAQSPLEFRQSFN
ncbi:helix-turn-helix domain-containing protein [Desertivirga arenae]|uniref:helix-turn-helix domain-containing protein n=1 Tax=Desertivirga arenae TaxID=2810309 RepID=UPI001A97AEAF|nr:helix-turn-helix domain-containing protein [Pedobacter sp. SYSU D00823]